MFSDELHRYHGISVNEHNDSGVPGKSGNDKALLEVARNKAMSNKRMWAGLLMAGFLEE